MHGSREQLQWFAMRDLSRVNAVYPMYKQLADYSVEVFTPMTRRLSILKGRRVSKDVPFIQDLLFVHESRERLDPIVSRLKQLQYRYVYGGYCEPMVVRDEDMARFIHAVSTTEKPKYYRPEEILPEMYGSKVRIVGGRLDGYEGHLLSVRGSKYRRLLVEIPNFITAAVEVQPDLIEVLPDRE